MLLHRSRQRREVLVYKVTQKWAQTDKGQVYKGVTQK